MSRHGCSRTKRSYWSPPFPGAVNRQRSGRAPSRVSTGAGAGTYRLLLNAYYVDRVYQALFVRPVLKLATWSGRFDLRRIDGAVNLSSRLTAGLAFMVAWEDLHIVDGIVNGLAEFFRRCGTRLRSLQTGEMQHYLYSVILGILGLCLMMLI